MESARPTVTVYALKWSSLFLGLLLVTLSVWAFTVSGAGALVALFGGVPGIALLAAMVGWWQRQKWTRRVLIAGLVLGLNNAFWTALFGFITMDAARPGFGETLMAVSLGLLAVFAILLFVLRTASVSRHLWAVEMGRAERTPDEELLEEVSLRKSGEQ